MERNTIGLGCARLINPLPWSSTDLHNFEENEFTKQNNKQINTMLKNKVMLTSYNFMH